MLKHVSYRSSSNFSKKSEFDSYQRSSINVAEFKENYNQNREVDFDNTRYKLSNRNHNSAEIKCTDTISLRNFNNEDSISINSSFSYGSFTHGNFTSRCSSTLSLNDPSAVPLKIYLRRLRPDMEYKTLPMSTATTCREMVLSLLAKFRLRHRDPNLFFVTMEVSVRASDCAMVKRILILDDNSRPAELQQCRPKGEARFSIGLRRGGLIRVYDSILMPGSQYKSLLIAHHTTTKEVVHLLLSCYNKTDSPNLYSIHEVCHNPFKDKILQDIDCPLEVQAKWPKYSRTNRCFIIRRNSVYNFHLNSKLSWRRSLDHGSTDTDSEPDEHNTTRASIISSGSTSSGISSISIDSSSSGISSGEDSCISTSSPIKFNKRVRNSLSSSSLYLFKSSLKQSNYPQTPIPMHSTPKLSSRRSPYLSISKLSIITDGSPTVTEKTAPSSDNQVVSIKQTSISTAPEISAQKESKRSQIPSNQISSATDQKPREIFEKFNSSSYTDLHPKVTPRRFSVVPIISTDIRYSRLNSQETRKLPLTPSILPVKKPPKPVPRTLFPPPIRSRSLGRDACLLEKKVDDSGCECPDHDTGCTMHTNNSRSSVSFAKLSHSSTKQAKIRSLSKSFGNLSVIPSNDDSNPSCCITYNNKKYEKDDKLSNTKNIECGGLKFIRSLTISLHNLNEDSQCKRNCQNCFYI